MALTIESKALAPGSTAAAATESAIGRRNLTPEERRMYDEQGYVIIPAVFPPEELEAIDQEIDGILARRTAERQASQEKGERQPSRPKGHHDETGPILQLGLRSAVCQRFAQDERVLDLIDDIVKPGIAIYSVKLIAKPPHTDVVCHWHQDDAYYVLNSDSQTRMSVWVPLQDAHERNGCLWVLPESHKWGLQPHVTYDYGQCRRAMRYEDIDVSRAIPVPVRAGSAVLFSALLWHYSKGNDTDRVRRAFITSYQEATVPRGNGDQWKILRPAAAAESE
ncbi:MAG: phytanoyl-CoA dioxygenase family protein [Chloroflexi bacterium]|nr:phytanoyl-CoA dioxygenase family protein [Chloroflexota bacterium]